MEKIQYTLDTFEVKLAIHLFLYILLLVIGVRFIKWRREKKPETGQSGQNAHRVRRVNIPLLAGIAVYALVMVLTVRSIISILSPVARVRTVSPSQKGDQLRYNTAIAVEFDVPIDPKKLLVNVNPKIDFSVNSYPVIPGFPFSRHFTLVPKLSYPPGEKIMVYLSNSKNPLSGDYGSEYLLEYETGKPPAVVESIPADGAEDVLTNTDVVVKLSGADTPQNIWTAESTPAAGLKIARSGDNFFTITFGQPLDQNTEYNIVVYKTPGVVDLRSGTVLPVGEKSKVLGTSFKTAKAPLVTSFEPSGDSVEPDAPVHILFDDPMDTDSVESHIALIPEGVKPGFSWSLDKTRLSILHQNFVKDTVYTVRLGKGTASGAGGVLSGDVSFTFRTLGKVSVMAPSPANTQTAAADSVIRIPLNQSVDHKSAESKFSIRPGVPGTFTWDGTTLVFKPDQKFKTGATYTYKLDSGVKSIHGLDSDQSFEFSFTTGPSEFALSVPFYYQEELFTCNIAAARQLLAFRGVHISEADLKAAIGSAGTRGNGDPNKTHVPNYGTYWDPVARGVSKYRPARVYKDWTLTQVLSEVQKGNPVMIWGQNGWSDPHEISWKNPDGTFIYAINGMHSSVVRGFRGPIENPSQILINDPWRGVYAVATGEFMRRWNFFKVAMVVD